MSTKKTEAVAPNSVDQIRDILFGEQINLIEKRFLELEETLSASIDRLTEKFDSNYKELKDQINDSKQQLNADTTSLEQRQTEHLNKFESVINAKIIETESDLMNQLQAEIQKLDNKASHRNELAQLLKDMAVKLAD